MGETHGAWRLYWQLLPVEIAQRGVARGWTAENEYPYRSGRCLIIKVPFLSRAVALGWWTRHSSETHNEYALAQALQFVDLDIEPSEIHTW